MKICSRCEESKSLDRFHKRKTSNDGLYNVCKDCRKLESASYYLKNIDRMFEKNHRYYDQNRDNILEQKKVYGQSHKEETSNRMKGYYLKRRDEILEEKKVYYENNCERIKIYRELTKERRSGMHRKWRLNNTGLRNSISARYRASKLQATVKWSNKKYIDLWYSISGLEKQRTGKECHVDHIVPLQSELVCGLHNEFNLQILFGPDNCSKGNRVWPDMP